MNAPVWLKVAGQIIRLQLCLFDAPPVEGGNQAYLYGIATIAAKNNVKRLEDLLRYFKHGLLLTKGESE